MHNSVCLPAEYMTSTPMPKKTEPPRRTKQKREPSPQRAVLESQLQLAVQVMVDVTN